MTMKQSVGDLTTLWADEADDEEMIGVPEIVMQDDPDTTDPAALRETHPETGEAAAHGPEETTGRSPKAERRRAMRQYAQRQRRAREATLQVLFEVDLVGHAVADVRERQFDQMLLTDDARAFAERLVDGVLTTRDRLDALIAELAPTWPTDQLPRVDINVLRLALYELLTAPETPTGAIINEAVELAKQYGSENSGKFINGVLGTVAARISAGEMARSMETVTHHAP